MTKRQRMKGNVHARSSLFEWTEWRIVCLILAMVFVAFTGALKGDFVYDDQVQVLRNPSLQNIGNIPKMFTQGVWQFSDTASERPVGNYYRPVFNSSLILNYRLFGFNVVGWHLFSLLLHLLSTLLVYLLSKQWGMSRACAAMTALLFGLHPIHSEPVAWISASPDLLVTAFVLASILFYERYYRGDEAGSHLLALSIVSALLAMLSKETGVLLPAFIALRELLDRSAGESVTAAFMRALKRALPFAAAAIVYLIVRYMVLGFISHNDPRLVGITGTSALLTIPSILLGYVRLLFVPYPLAFVYGYDYVKSVADPRFWVALLALILIAVVAVRLLRSSAIGRRALLMLALFTLPVLNLRAFNPYESLMHDRYMYLPSVGFCMLAALGFAWLAERLNKQRRFALNAAMLVIALMLFGLTWFQNLTWRNDLAMAAQALRWTPQQAYALDHAGRYYAEHDQLAEAEQSLVKAVAIRPDSYDFQTDLAYVYTRQKKYDEAVESYRKAISLGINYPFTFYNLGVTYLSQGKLDEAVGAFKRTLELQPVYPEALYNLGWIDEHRGQLEQAEKTYLEVIRQKPSYASPYIDLSGIYVKQGRYQEAADILQSTLRQRSNNPEALLALGSLYLKTSHCREAITPLEQLARLSPQHQSVYAILGLSYECAGDIERAKTSYTQAIQLAPQAPATNVAREHLATLQGRTGL